MSYIADSEVPTHFHRWALITGVGAFLGRSLYLHHGHFTLYPNMYTMLIGSPGTRKSTAIKIMKQLLIKAGYLTIAADKTSKEKFLLDISTGAMEEENLEVDLWGSALATLDDAECFIMADEFNDFLGSGNMDFISLLGNLWDYSGVYSSRIKNGKSVAVNNPTVSILGGNTPVSFAAAFPPEVLGQGFFSRLLLIYGESTEKKITFPKAPPEHVTVALIEEMQRIKQYTVGEATLSPGAEKLLDKMYKLYTPMEDVRFEHYSNRRFTHLLKLTLVIAAFHRTTQVVEHHVIYANTILTRAEHQMGKALGEFGKSKNSDVSQKIMQLLDGARKPVTLQDMWIAVHNDLDSPGNLADLLRNLVAAKKIVGTQTGYLSRKDVLEDQEEADGLVDFTLLTEEERGL